MSRCGCGTIMGGMIVRTSPTCSRWRRQEWTGGDNKNGSLHSSIVEGGGVGVEEVVVAVDLWCRLYRPQSEMI